MALGRTAVVAASLTLTLAAPVAYADQADPVQEGAREQSCRQLEASTVGNPQDFRQDDGPGITDAWPEAPKNLLPASVELRTANETFNRRYEFATREGRIFGRNRAGGGAWREMTLPLCFAGRVASISLDDDELIALDTARRIYTMDNALKDATLFNWSSRWGTPFWTGLGYSLPEKVEAWAWSVISPVEDVNWTDPAGNRTPVGGGKVSHIWGLRTGGQRLTFWDPWLPLDESYEMCGPQRGRFKAVNLSASGSSIFVIGRFGDMWTRFYDFDISGHDTFFFNYSYEDQRGKGDGAPIQLPAAPWVHQPKIPGTITSAISIEKTGVDGIHRILRVEGESAGHTGWWERDTAAPAVDGWTFHESGRPLRAKRLRNTGEPELGQAEDERYTLRTPELTAELSDFNVYCPPAHLRVTRGGKTEDLLLQHLDPVRQQARGRGLDEVPRTQEGVIARPDGTFQKATIEATREQITIKELGWTFKRDPLPRCLPARAAIGPRSIGAVRLGLTRAALARRLPGAKRRSARSLEWCVDGGGRVVAVLSRRRVALVTSSATGHGRRGVHPGSSRAALERAFPRARKVGAGLFRANPGTRLLFAMRRGKVARVVVASRATIRRPARLRRQLRLAGGV